MREGFVYGIKLHYLFVLTTSSDRSPRPSMVGYTDLSSLMSKHPEVFILRSFRDLNVKNILYYEAELAHLECELREVEEEDEAEKTLPRKEYAVNWKRMS